MVSAIGIVLVDGECQTNGGPIESCCCLGYNNTHCNAKSPGVYTIGNFGGVKCSNTRVYCDTTTGGGGWLVVQRRKDESVDFNRDWIDYEDGFGSLTEEFWFGLRGMHTLTNQEQWELCIDYIFPNTTKSHLSYSNFRVGSATEQYPLTISGFDGATQLIHLVHFLFTSRDKDNDFWDKNCAIHWAGGSTGGWWYRDCTHIPLNDLFHPNRKTAFLNGQWQRISTWEMKIRPKDCRI